jgi:peptidyl-prolyl cis-trans isomerase D
MLQKLRDKSTGWIAKVILLLLAIPFLFFGMEQYMTQRIDSWVAKVEAPPTWWPGAPAFWPVSMLWEEEYVEAAEFRERFDQARQQQRQQQGEAFDAAAFEHADNKRRVLERLVDERILRMAARRSGVVVGDDQVRAMIRDIPAFQVGGRFDAERYQIALASQVPARTPRQFEQLVRESLEQSLIAESVASSAFVTASQLDRMMALLGERRDVAWVVVPATAPAAGSPQAQVDDAAIQAWYASHPQDFRAPETVAIEYIVLDAAALPAPPAADEATLRERFARERASLSGAGQRLASHILVQDEEQARSLAQQARAPGADFAALAREHSQDTGSAGAGGDLGWIAPGTMGDAFDEALFAMEPGQVSDPVRSEFGWHVIQLREVQAGEGPVAFEDVRERLAAEQAEEDRVRAYSDLAGKVVDEVYRNPNTLAPAAQLAGTEVRTTPPFPRGGGSGIAAEPAVQRAAFSQILIEDGTVSDLIELPDGRGVLLRVAEHTPERTRPLAEVREQVVAAILADRARKAAQAAAQEMVAAVEGGQALDAVAQARGLAAVEMPGLPRGAPIPDPAVAAAMFAAPAPEQGAVSAGKAELADGGVAVFVVRSVTPGDVAEAAPEEREQLRAQLVQVVGFGDGEAYVSALRERMRVTVAEDRL